MSGCNFITLGNYNSTNPGTMQHSRVSSSGRQYGLGSIKEDIHIVPVWGAIGFNTLTHGEQAPTCSGHFNISQAYGADAANCNTRFVKRLCSGNLEQ